MFIIMFLQQQIEKQIFEENILKKLNDYVLKIRLDQRF